MVSVEGGKIERLSWPDVAKGIGIFLVVVGHTVGGIINAGLVTCYFGGPSIFLIVYLFHMPLFFFLSGIFVPQRLAKSEKNFVTSLLQNILYPYVLWSIIQHTIVFTMGSSVNYPVTDYWGTILSLGWKTVSQFWFLHALAVMHVFALLFWKRLHPVAVLAISMSFYMLSFHPALPTVISSVMRYFPFYGMGLIAGRLNVTALPSNLLSRSNLVVVVLAATAALAFNYFYLIGFKTPWDLCAMGDAVFLYALSQSPTVMASAILVIAAVILISMALKGPLQKLLAAIGQRSMPIFLMHVLFVAGLRIVMMKLFGAGNGLLLFLAAVAAGVAGPMIAYFVFKRLKVNRLLGMP